MGWLKNLFGGKRDLDDRLLSGELSPDTGEGRARAEELVSPHHRELAAKALRDLIEEAGHDRPSFFNANLRVRRFPLRENAALILTLARELEELPEVNFRGVILADRLVTDGDSPVYGIDYDHQGLIHKAVEEARTALKAG